MSKLINAAQMLREATRLKNEAEQQFLEEFGANVKRIRESKGLKQEQVAQIVGVGRTSIANLEAGRQDIPISRVLFLCSSLECEPSDLMPYVNDVREDTP